jgi:hypothetical protein
VLLTIRCTTSVQQIILRARLPGVIRPVAHPDHVVRRPEPHFQQKLFSLRRPYGQASFGKVWISNLSINVQFSMVF